MKSPMRRILLVTAWLSSCAATTTAPVTPPPGPPSHFQRGVDSPAETGGSHWIARAITTAPSREQALHEAHAEAVRMLAGTKQDFFSRFESNWRESSGTDRRAEFEEISSLTLRTSSTAKLSELVPTVMQAVPCPEGFVAWVELQCPDRVLMPENRLYQAIGQHLPYPALLELARTYEAQAQPDNAKATLIYACTRDLGSEARLALADLHVRLGDEAAAVRLFDEVASNPACAEAARLEAQRLADAIRNRLPTLDGLASEWLATAQQIERGARLDMKVATGGGRAFLRWSLTGRDLRLFISRLDDSFCPHLDPPGLRQVAPDEGQTELAIPAKRATFAVWCLPRDAAVWGDLAKHAEQAYRRDTPGESADRASLRAILKQLGAQAKSAIVVQLP